MRKIPGIGIAAIVLCVAACAQTDMLKANLTADFTTGSGLYMPTTHDKLIFPTNGGDSFVTNPAECPSPPGGGALLLPINSSGAGLFMRLTNDHYPSPTNDYNYAYSATGGHVVNLRYYFCISANLESAANSTGGTNNSQEKQGAQRSGNSSTLCGGGTGTAGYEMIGFGKQFYGAGKFGVIWDNAGSCGVADNTSCTAQGYASCAGNVSYSTGVWHGLWIRICRGCHGAGTGDVKIVYYATTSDTTGTTLVNVVGIPSMGWDGNGALGDSNNMRLTVGQFYTQNFLAGTPPWNAYFSHLYWGIDQDCSTAFSDGIGCAGLNGIVADSGTFTAPANLATISGASVTVSASITPGQGTASTQFWYTNNSHPIGTVQSGNSPSVSFDTTPLTNGTYTLGCDITDSGGGSGNCTTISVTVSNVLNGDTCSISVPASPLSGSVTVTGACTPGQGACNAWQATLGGSNFGAGQTGAGPYSVTATTNTINCLDGVCTFAGTCGDSGGGTGVMSSVTRTVKNAITPRLAAKH